MDIIGTQAFSNQIFIGNFAPFSASRIQLEFKGVRNATAQTTPLTDLGTLLIRSKKFGQLWYIPIQNLQDLNNLYGGQAVSDYSTISVNGNAIAEIPMQIMTPLGVPSDRNAIHVDASWGLELYIQGFNNALWASGTLAVSVEPSDDPQKYVPYFDYIDRATSAGQTDKFPLDKPNVCSVWLTTADQTSQNFRTGTQVIGNILLSLDNGKKINSDWGKLNGNLNNVLEVEALNNVYAFSFFNPTLETYERISTKVDPQVQYITGAKTARFIFQGTFENAETNMLFNASAGRINEKVLSVARKFPSAVGALAASINVSTSELKTAAGV